MLLLLVEQWKWRKLVCATKRQLLLAINWQSFKRNMHREVSYMLPTDLVLVLNDLYEIQDLVVIFKYFI